MRDVVICSAARTAVGTFGGALAGTPLTGLATHVAVEAIGRANLQPCDVDQTVFGNVIHTEPRDVYLSRVAAIGAGVPETAPALTLNRLCGSGLQAVVAGAEQIQLGNADVVLTGGAESMSRVGHMIGKARFGAKMGDVSATDMMIGALTDPFGHGHMGETAENVAEVSEIDRETQDAYALESHRRAAAAIDAGRFDDQIVPMTVQHGRKETVFLQDEHVRRDVTLGDLARLRPAFRKDGSVTPGNSSGINDGAAALIVADSDTARNKGIAAIAKIRSSAVSGVAPEVMGMGPVPAVTLALKRAGLSVEDLACIESNEAFAAQACAVSKALGFAPERTNPNGGAIALGHPVGASGAIILTKLIYELRRIAGRYGLATMCIGGGQGIAVVIENLDVGA
ncbi:MAG: acetyl-CoA C-acyltransferase [Boseongicola sp. SB0673_bin_14]|nr:beta-ketothiolase BktB [Boseongicola sp.]MXW87722.1 acetyl-CoA C-acyltransferase [Boseongicola sp. SB0667_bin_21]MYI70709.1 acetyl-CoA C-acyltransferase [Boseongicola sp. SB0673_bin_14]